MTSRILLVDDHTIVRSGLRALLENRPGLEVIAEAEDGRSGVRLAKELSPDIVLIDISMPDLNGIEATRQMTAAQPDVKVLILSMHAQESVVPEAFRAGASGYLLKDCALDELLTAIRTVRAGKPYISAAIAGLMLGEFLRDGPRQSRTAFSVLSGREREVLQLLAEGRSAKDIAYQFGLSVKTVEAHRQHIMNKLNVHSIAELTKYAIRAGLTPLDE